MIHFGKSPPTLEHWFSWVGKNYYGHYRKGHLGTPPEFSPYFFCRFIFFLLVQNIVPYFPSHTNLLLYREYKRRHLDLLLELSLEMHVNLVAWNFFICPNILKDKKSVNTYSTAARIFLDDIFVILLTCVIISLLQNETSRCKAKELHY
jgi:hypothetical protein